VEDFITLVGQFVNRHPLVRSHVGTVYPSGKYELAFDKAAAKGWLSMESMGEVGGRATVEAVRPSKGGEWAITAAVLYLDRDALSRRTAARRERAGEAGDTVEDPPANHTDPGITFAKAASGVEEVVMQLK